MNNTSLVLSFHLAVFKAWSTEPSKQRLLGQDYPLFLSSAGPNIIHLSSEDMRFFFFYPQHRCCIFPLSVSTLELPFPTQCQSFTVEWKMCPISQGQANNDWKAIEVKQTDSIQLVIAVFASVSTCEEVSRKTFFFFFARLSIFLPSFPSLIQVVAFGHHDICSVLAYFYVKKKKKC